MNIAFLYATLLWLISVGVYQSHKPLPHGIDFASDTIYASINDAELLTDLTAFNSSGDTIHEHEIFDSVFAYIEKAEEYILIDMFLFNQYTGPSGYVYRDLTGELKRILISQKHKYPELKIDFITDPVNVFYGGSISPELEELKAHDINVVITDLSKIRDSAPIYSSIWRTFFQWFGNTDSYGFLPNPFDMKGKKVTLRSYLDFLNLKANHRKICIVDSPAGPVSFVISANPHSASSDFSNVGVMVKGDFALELYETEQAVANMSKASLQGEAYLSTVRRGVNEEYYKIRILTEKQIKQQLLSSIDGLVANDTLFIGMFYFSNRDIIKSLIRASDRGVILRLVLDPNKDGFGFYRNGIPNQVIAGELMKKPKNNISIRWYHTHGEEFHSKLILTLPQKGPASLLIGSSNYTRKNLDNFNLELDVVIDADRTTSIILDSREYFEKIWSNAGNLYTVDYKRFEHTGPIRTLQYRFQECTGLGVY